MKVLRVWLNMVLAFVLAAGSASAAQLLFTPRATVTEEYNDNIDLDRKDKKDDFITTVTVGGTIELLGQVSGLRVTYEPGYSFYADYDEYNSWRHDLTGSVWHDFSRQTRLELTETFFYTKDPLADDDVEDSRGNIIARGNDRRRERDTYYRNYATARMRHQFGAEDSVYAQFAHGLVKYDDPAEEDSQELSPSAGLTYWFTQWTGMELEGIYTRGLYDEEDSSDFSNYRGRVRLIRRISQQFGVYGQYMHIYRDWDEEGTLSASGEIENNYSVYAPSAGLTYRFDRDLSASLGAGWFYQQIENDQDEQGPFVSADINKLWDYQRWNIRARASSGIDSEDFTNDSQGFERFAQVELIGRYNFTRDFFGDASLSYRYSDYLNSEEDEVDHRYTADVGLGYSLTRWMTLRLAYQFNKLDAINSTDDYEQNRVYATITLQPDQPWRLWD